MTAFDIEVRIEMDEPWRIGTGIKGPGMIDDETWATADRSSRTTTPGDSGDARARGNVTVPASHLKGKLRQQAEWLAPLVGMVVCGGRLLDGARHPGQQDVCQPGRGQPCPGCRVFGSARIPPGWHFTPAVLELPSVSDRHDAAILSEAQRGFRAHNQVDPWFRRTSEDFLYTLEHARPGVALTATIGWLFPSAPLDDEMALLVASVGALDILGGRGRRGYGACRAWVTNRPGGVGHDEWIDRFAQGEWGQREWGSTSAVAEQ